MTYVVWHYVLYRIFNKLFFVTLNVFRFSFIEMKLTCVWCIFRFFFFLIFSFVFLKLWLSLLLNTQNYENNYEGAERKRREKEEEKKKNIFNRKKSKIRNPPPYPLSTNIQFWSKHNLLLGIPKPWGNFWIFLENFNNKINKVTYCFFLC